MAEELQNPSPNCVKFICQTKCIWVGIKWAFFMALLGVLVWMLLWSSDVGILTKIVDYASNHEKKYMALLYYGLTSIGIIFWIILLYHILKHQRTKKYYDAEMKKEEGLEYILHTIKELDFSMLRYNTIGVAMMVIVMFTMGVLGIFVFDLFTGTVKSSIELIERTELNNQSVIFLIVVHMLRTSLVGAFIMAILVYSFKFTNASFDQATRFNKRKHAGLFLMQLMKDAGVDRDIKEIMNAFKEWNVNIESAYSPNKVDPQLFQSSMDRTAKFEEAILEMLKKDKEKKEESK